MPSCLSSKKLEFTTPLGESPGTIFSLLCRSYANWVGSHPQLWQGESASWEQYDHEVYQQPNSVGASIFLSRLSGIIVGFASWDPRQGPRLGTIGHNCILPEFRRNGLGKQQVLEILRRFQEMGFQTARVSTLDHTFFIPAQRMYIGCEFIEIRRHPWERDPRQNILEYEKKIGNHLCK